MVTSDEDDVVVAREGRAFFGGNGEMNRVQRSQPTLDDEGVRDRKNHFWTEAEEGNRSIFLTIRVYPGKDQSPAPKSPSPGGGPNRARELNPRELACDDRLVAFKEHVPQVGVICLVSKVGTD